MRIVVDASVALKWVLVDEVHEPNTVQALEILAELRGAAVEAVQPCHWLAEVAAVLARKAPKLATEALDLLDAMEFATANDAPLLKQAAALSEQLNHHLFDTLYHALALRSGAWLVTADEPYYRKARSLGRIVRLADWPPDTD